MGFSFFKTPQHKVFNYQPLYYDERKERRENVRADALREKAQREGTEFKDENYYPGKYIKGKIQENSERNRKHAVSQKTLKIIGMLSIAIFFLFLAYFAQSFVAFMQSVQ